MDLSATCNVVDLAQYQDPSALDWQGFVDSGVKAVIIQLSHGTSYEPYAREHIAKANQYGLIVHGYHYYEGTSGEVDFSISNANTVGLSKNSYMFLDFEDTTIQGDWQSQSFDFFNAWKSAGWNAGLYTGNSLYQSKFNNDVLVANGIYRWIAQYGSNSGSPELNWEPINYDIWQYSSVGGIGYYNSNLDKSYDRTGKLITKETTPPPVITTDPHEPPTPIAGAYVGTGFDTTGLNGGKGFGYSTNGHDFYLALSPFGFIFKQVDADRMWELIKPKIGTLQGAKGEKGDIGITGATGAKGDIGATGKAGADGKTPYLHIAYANSADGKDGFYVGGNQNYFQGSQLFTGQAANHGSQHVTVTFEDYDSTTKMLHVVSDGVVSASSGMYWPLPKLDSGTAWAFSADMKGSGIIRIMWRENSTPMNDMNTTLTNDWVRYSNTGTLTDNAKGSWCIYFDCRTVQVDAYIKLVKVEKGSVATPWVPAVEDNVQPKYMGTYTDYTQADSTDPTQYLWSQIQGPIGETGPQGPAGKDGVGASVDLTPYAKKTEVIPSNLVSLEINADATFDTPFIDFHTKTGVNDYDARIIVAGGKSGAVGQANMNIVANGGVIVNGKKVATVDQINPWTSITDKGHDLNTVITDGRYWCKAAMGNAPVATWGYLYVNAADPGRVQQDFVSDSTAEKYIRMKFGDSWTAWIQETTNQLGQLVQTIKGTAATNFELDGTANAYVYQLAPSLKLVAINAGVNPKSGVSIPEWSVTTLINWASAMPAYSSAINDAVYILGNTSIVAGNFQTNSFGVVNGSVKIDTGSGHTKINVAYLSKS